MNACRAGSAVVLSMAAYACSEPPAPTLTQGCEIDAPRELLPSTVGKIRVGMSSSAVRRLLGKPDYSPVDGQHYFFTGGLCPMAPGADILASCGVVAEFRRFDYGTPDKDVVTDILQACHWGAIGE